MSEIYAFTASPGHNGLIDVFAIGDPGDDDSGTTVFLSRAAPGDQWPPWASAGLPDLGAIGLQGIAGPDGYGHILARAGGREAAKDYGDLWFRERGENDDFSDWQGLGLPPPAGTRGDPMISPLKEWNGGDYSALAKNPAAVDWSYALVNLLIFATGLGLVTLGSWLRARRRHPAPAPAPASLAK